MRRWWSGPALAEARGPRSVWRKSLFPLIVLALGAAAVGLALLKLHANTVGVEIEARDLQGTPLAIYRPSSGPVGPAVVIAHGFAGSGRLMQSFALMLARNGYVAVAFDLPGHGRNPAPLSGDLASVDGATQVLVKSLGKVADAARSLGDGRLAVLGHSMASDVVVRYAEAHPDVAATVAISMFSPAVTATEPRNLLVIDGEWEGFLKAEALRVVGLKSAPAEPQAGVTYGDFAAGTARRAAVAPHVEHASVLFSQAAQRETLAWLNAAFGVERSAPPALDDRGPWIALMVAGVVALAWPLSKALPAIAKPPVGAGLGWRALPLPLLAPALATPVLLRFAPTHFLPVLVADYLSAHLALYGVLTALALAASKGARPLAESAEGVAPARVAIAVLLVTGWVFVSFILPIDAYVTSFAPGFSRLFVLAALIVGALVYMLADEWATRGPGAGRGAYAASKLALIASLSLAIALDFKRLFFLIIILPIIVLIFLIFGLYSGWTYRRTGYPFVGATANAIALAWALASAFPLVAG